MFYDQKPRMELRMKSAVNHRNLSAAETNSSMMERADEIQTPEIVACTLAALCILLISFLVCLHVPLYRSLKLNEVLRKVKTADFVSFLVSLLFTWAILLAAMLTSTRETTCTVVAALIFAAVLVFAFSAVLEAVLMYFLFIKIWGLQKSSYKWVFASLQWALSFVITVIIAVSSPELFRTAELRCWPSRALFYYGMAVPSAVCVVVALSIVVMVIVQSFRRADSPVTRCTAAKVGRKAARMASSLLLLVLLWGTAYGAFHTGRAVYYYVMGACHVTLTSLTVRRSLAQSARHFWLDMLHSCCSKSSLYALQERAVLHNGSPQRETNQGMELNSR